MTFNYNNTILKVAFRGVPLSIVITSLKFIAWYLTDFISLLSDSLESTINVATALITYFTIRYAYLPADSNHPFGHQKAEYIAAVAEGILIIVVALMILQGVWKNALDPSISKTPATGLAISIVTSIINILWGRLLIRIGEKHRSPALKASGQHVISDVITSVSIVIGLTLVMATGYTIVDPVIAILVALNILYQGWKVVFSSITGLMDGAVAPKDSEAIKKAIAANAVGSLGVHDLKTRQAGAAFFVDFHLVVRSDTTVSEAHKICDRLEKSIKNAAPGTLVAIHVEPESESAHGVYVKLKETLDHA